MHTHNFLILNFYFLRITKIVNRNKYSNFRSIRAKEVKVDSKVISFKVRVNPDPKKTDQLMNQKSYTENCVPDEDIMKYKPVRMTFFHYDRSTSKRKLLWHDGDAKTGVN